MNSSVKDYDDLTRIKGIGSARQQWLRESLGIHTIRDLAARSVKDIESRLKAEGHIASRSSIEEWIIQAREIAAVTSQSEPLHMTAAAGIEEDMNVAVEDKGWKPFASFVVEFQACADEGQVEEQRISVHYMEADVSAAWPGIACERLCDWMQAQVGDRVRPLLEGASPVSFQSEAKSESTAPSIKAEVTQIRVFQPPDADTPISIGQTGPRFLGFIRGNQPFALEVALEFTNPPAADVTRREDIHDTQFHIQSLTSGTSSYLVGAIADIIDRNKKSYSAVLAETLLQPGLYRLGLLLKLQSRSPGVAYLELPMITVM